MDSINQFECYLCDSKSLVLSKTHRMNLYLGTLRKFYKCNFCSSVSLLPRPSAEELIKLYSPDYSCLTSDPDMDKNQIGHDKFSLLRCELARMYKELSPHPIFLDYGCGDNPTNLYFAGDLGYQVVGVELNQEVTQALSIGNSFKVFSLEQFKTNDLQYDCIFMGDVIEHLTNPMGDLSEITSKLKSSGYIVLQGPLEASVTLCHLIVKLKAIFLKSISTEIPPYHLSLATLTGIKKLVELNDLRIEKLLVTEIRWPAPNLSQLKSNFSLTNIVMLFAKQVDILLSRIRPNYGNYFFAVLSLNEK